MKFLIPNICLILAATATYAANSPIGFGKDTTGGEGGIIYHVTSFKELLIALNNNKKPKEPKVIYVDSPINAFEDDEGNILTAKDFSPNYVFEEYVNCFTDDGKTWNSSAECAKVENYRKTGYNNQNLKVKVKVTPNTTIIGSGLNSKLEEVSIQIHNVNNVIIKDLYIQAPTDLFPGWDPKDSGGNWNSEYDGIVISGSTNVWIDNCYITDGDKTDDTFQNVFGKHIQAHDGLLDVVNGSDFVTISNTRFEDHQKTILIGNSDSKAAVDTGHLKVTMYNNVFINCGERLPRVRFGKVHVFNNYYFSDKSNIHSYVPQYFIGLGKECNVLSEYNSFNYVNNNSLLSKVIAAKGYGGNTFHDNGSEYNGKQENIDAAVELAMKGNVNFITFEPTEYYQYNPNRDLNFVNDLVNHVPSWMFGESDVPEPEPFEEPEPEPEPEPYEEPIPEPAPEPEPYEEPIPEPAPGPEPEPFEEPIPEPVPEPEPEPIEKSKTSGKSNQQAKKLTVTVKPPKRKTTKTKKQKNSKTKTPKTKKTKLPKPKAM